MSEARKLLDLDPDEVSLVDRPAIERTFLVIKRAENIDKQLEPRDGMSRDELRDLLEQRARRYGIEVVEGAALSWPSGFPRKLDDYGDPVNLKYPLDTKARAANARVRFKQNASQYERESSRKVVHTRIVERELDYDIKPTIDPDDPLDRLLPQALRDRIARGQNSEGAEKMSKRETDETTEKGKTEVEEKDEAQKAAKPEDETKAEKATTIEESVKAVVPWLRAQAEKADGPMAAHLKAVAAELGKRKISKAEAAEVLGTDLETIEKAKRMTDARAKKLAGLVNEFVEFAKQFGEDDEDEMKEDKGKEKAKTKKAIDDDGDPLAMAMAAVAKAIEGVSNINERLDKVEKARPAALSEAPEQKKTEVKKSREELDAEIFAPLFTPSK